MATIGDPVTTGIVASLSRPGGNITGLSNQATGLGAKRLEMLHEILHGLARVAVLWNPDNASVDLIVQEIEAAARALGTEVESLRARLPSDIEEGFQRAADVGVKAVLTGMMYFSPANGSGLSAGNAISAPDSYPIPTIRRPRGPAELWPRSNRHVVARRHICR